MIKKILYFIFTTFLTFNVFAQEVVVDGVGVLTDKPENPGSIGRVLKWGTNKVLHTPIKISGKVVGACLLSKKVCAGIAAGSLSFAYLYDHPEAVEHYLEKHPDKYDDLQKYFDYRKSQTQDVAQIDKYEKAADDVGINAKTLEEQLDLENNDADFEQILKMLENIALSIDNAQTMKNYTDNNCSIDVAKTLVELSPAEFNNLINLYLPKENIAPEILFSFDKYGNLKSKSHIMESDHIPSYKALEYLFINYGVSFQGKSKSSNRYNNLQNNATALIIPYDTHKKNRTYGKSNLYLYTTDGLDSNSLRSATLKDFATLLWLEKNNQINFKYLIKVLPEIYIRNKMLCLYNLDNSQQNNFNLQQITQNLNNFDYQNFINQINK